MVKRILLIETNPAAAKAIAQALVAAVERGFSVEWVTTCADGLLALTPDGEHGAVAAIVVDLLLADSQGIDTFEQLFHLAPHIPMLVLCDPHDEQLAKAAVHRGAQDYLLKTRIDSYTLPKAINNMIERAAYAAALFEEKERTRVTLSSIGDAVMSVDTLGNVNYLNAVAEILTGWSLQEAAGQASTDVFHVIDATTGLVVADPMTRAMDDNQANSLGSNCLLVRRDGVATAIEDSVAPIHDRYGQITGAVMVFHDVSLARTRSLKLAHLAQYDSLTDLPNRALFNDRLTHAIALAHRRFEKLAVMFLDVDGFKRINDSLGHAVGDQFLKSVAQRLLECVRTSDTVSRQGGDEFVILLADVTQPTDVKRIAKKILDALRIPHRVGDQDIHLTGSIGIATYPKDGLDADTLVKNADIAMYQAKNKGRDNCQLFKPSKAAALIERQVMQKNLIASEVPSAGSSIAGAEA